MSWDNVTLNKESNTEKKNEYTKFPEGDTYIKVLSDEPHIRWQHWIPKVNRGLTCPGKDCPICLVRKAQKEANETPKYSMSRRLAVNIWNYSTNRLEIMEQGVTFFEDLRDLRRDLMDDNKGFQDVQIRVRRRGTGKENTSYRLDIHNDLPLSDEEKKAMEEMPDLNTLYKPNTIEQCKAAIEGATWEEILKLGETQEVEYEVS